MIYNWLCPNCGACGSSEFTNIVCPECSTKFEIHIPHAHTSWSEIRSPSITNLVARARTYADIQGMYKDTPLSAVSLVTEMADALELLSRELTYWKPSGPERSE